MYGSILVLTTNRSNIMFSAYLCAKFREDPKTTLSEELVWIHQKVLHIFMKCCGFARFSSIAKVLVVLSLRRFLVSSLVDKH